MRTNAQMRVGWAVAGLVMVGVFLGAQRARAGDDFERGFKNELGRIAAREVVHVGRHLVSDVVWGHGYYPRRPHYARPAQWRYGPQRSVYRHPHPYRARRPSVVREFYYSGAPCAEHREYHHHR